jgi:uncharacterized membrane protein (UPF0127 family)
LNRDRVRSRRWDGPGEQASERSPDFVSEAAEPGTQPADDPTRSRAARNETRGTTLATTVETAASLWARFLGLMGRRSLPDGHGLWLPGDNGIHMFFMRFPIDAVFVGSAGPDGSSPVLAAKRSLRPWTGIVPLVRGASGVLELPAGAIEASGTVVGDLVRIG